MTTPVQRPYALTRARDSEWQWHQLGHMQICISPQTDNHISTTTLFFTGRMPFLLPNQQHQSIEGNLNHHEFNTVTRRRSESAYIRQVHDNVIMYTFTCLHTRLPSNVRAQ